MNHLTRDNILIPRELTDVTELAPIYEPKAPQVVSDEKGDGHQQSQASNYQVAHPQEEVLAAHPRVGTDHKRLHGRNSKFRGLPGTQAGCTCTAAKDAQSSHPSMHRCQWACTSLPPLSYQQRRGMRAICKPAYTKASFLNVKIAVMWQDRKYQ